METALAAITESESMIERAFAEAFAQPDELDETSNRVLDGAYEQFCRKGIRSSTMEDVAKRAGVSRITVYRRFSTKDALVEQLVRREYRRYFDQFVVDIRDARSAADRVVLGFVSSLRTIRSNELISTLMIEEPSSLVPSIIGDGGRVLTSTVRRFVAGQLRREQAAGNVAAEIDVDLVAELMVRMSTSFLITPSDVVDLADDDQLADLARRFLVPMLEPTT